MTLDLICRKRFYSVLEFGNIRARLAVIFVLIRITILSEAIKSHRFKMRSRDKLIYECKNLKNYLKNPDIIQISKYQN